MGTEKLRNVGEEILPVGLFVSLLSLVHFFLTLHLLDVMNVFYIFSDYFLLTS